MVTKERPRIVQDSPILDKLIEAYWELELRDPRNKLLSYAPNLSMLNFKGTPKFTEEYYKRFTDPRDDYGTFGWVRYTSALEEALKCVSIN